MKDKKETTIEEAGKELPFNVPENYFNNFTLQMESHLSSKPTLPRKTIKPWMYMAAMFIGVLILSQVMFNVLQTTKVINDDSYESYVLSQINENNIIDLYVESYEENN